MKRFLIVSSLVICMFMTSIGFAEIKESDASIGAPWWQLRVSSNRIQGF